MSLISENPTLFVKHRCPFCLKVRLYLLEAGLIDTITLRESRSPGEEDAMKAELSPHLAKVSYPTLRLGDTYMTESDETSSPTSPRRAGRHRSSCRHFMPTSTGRSSSFWRSTRKMPSSSRGP